jgi:septation ring formation regulator EzrA
VRSGAATNRRPASSALWRAYRALSAARYHLQDQPLEGKIRELRDQIEEIWRDVEPLHEEPEEESKRSS